LDFFGLATYKDGGDHRETATEMGRNKEKTSNKIETTMGY
jgi:hypothetical protein